MRTEICNRSFGLIPIIKNDLAILLVSTYNYIILVDSFVENYPEYSSLTVLSI